jgi:hypothetical protein
MAAPLKPATAIQQNLENFNRDLAEKIDAFLKNNPKEKYEITNYFIELTKNIEEIKKLLDSNAGN